MKKVFMYTALAAILLFIGLITFSQTRQNQNTFVNELKLKPKVDSVKVKIVIAMQDSLYKDSMEQVKGDTMIIKMTQAIMQINNSDLPDSSKEQLIKEIAKEKEPQISVKGMINTLLDVDNYKSLKGWRDIAIAILGLLAALELFVRNTKWAPTSWAPTSWVTKIFGKHKGKSKGLSYCECRTDGHGKVILIEFSVPENIPTKLELVEIPRGYEYVLIKLPDMPDTPVK